MEAPKKLAPSLRYEYLKVASKFGTFWHGLASARRVLKFKKEDPLSNSILHKIRLLPISHVQYDAIERGFVVVNA